jgi:hypothetical protein
MLSTACIKTSIFYLELTTMDFQSKLFDLFSEFKLPRDLFQDKPFLQIVEKIKKEGESGQEIESKQ